tara:strand:- start:535 stop:681 length:147 start_codon:yes stop_codon:yes gene_type:complete
MKRYKGWELSAGIYPGILIGGRSYIEENFVEHVLYLPFFECCLTVYYE